MTRTTLFAGLLLCASAMAAGPTDADSIKAQAVLAPTQGNGVSGQFDLSGTATGVRLSGTVQGLEPGSRHGIHVHEAGDCSAADAKSAGEHYNPGRHRHGDPSTAQHHLGDMPNLVADSSGEARFETEIAGATLAAGDNSLMNRAIIVHAEADDFKTQPSGASGARVACGVIKTAK
jgi:Cu-Zn family superoxide dismutase